MRFTPEGQLLQIPDYATRHKYMESGYKIKRIMEGDAPQTNISINVPDAVAVAFNLHGANQKAEGNSHRAAILSIKRDG